MSSFAQAKGIAGVASPDRKTHVIEVQFKGTLRFLTMASVQQRF